MPATTPLLLLPGLMNDERVWQRVLPLLHGGRDIVTARTDQADSIAELAEIALDSAPDERFAVAGFSLGGYVALEIFRQVPDRIAGMGLLDTGARDETDEGRQARQRMIDALAAGGDRFGGVAGGFLPRAVHASRVNDQALSQLLSDMARAVGAKGFVRQQQAALSRADSRGTLPRIDVPALVLCGIDDMITPPSLAEEMAQALPASQLSLVPSCGHMSPLEQPGAVAAAMNAWLAWVDVEEMAGRR